MAVNVWAEGKRPAALDAPDQAAATPAPQNTASAAAPTTAAAPAATTPAPTTVATPAPEVNVPKYTGTFPYVGEITAADLNVRSGAGTNFYSCGKIGNPTRVIVVDQKDSWSQILPPPGNFSWIFKQYVTVDVNKSDVGIVNSDNVRVYAGSDERDAMVSDSQQITLNKQAKVRLIGQPVGDYYKISPPEGATLWLNSQYIKFVRKADEIDMKIPKQQEQSLTASTTDGEKEKQVTTPKPKANLDQVDPNSRYLEKYYALAKQLEEEKAKPMADQNYAEIRAGFEALANDKSAGKAAQYSEYTLKSVTRFELAKKASESIDSDKSNLQKQLDDIEKERQAKKDKLPKTTHYAITGIFKPSALYHDRPDIKRYLIMDDKNVPVSYAAPAGQADGMELSQFFGKRVGLVGIITNDATTNFPLVKFTNIEVMEDEATTTPPMAVPASVTEVKDVNALPVDTNVPKAVKEANETEATN